MAVRNEAEALCRELAAIPDDYSVLFLQGGASLQFSMVPMNFLSADSTADYANTGAWSKKAIAEARRFGNVHVTCSGEESNFDTIPDRQQYSSNPAYVHFTSNNTIFGTEYQEIPDSGKVPLIADMSSDILSQKIDATKFALICFGSPPTSCGA